MVSGQMEATDFLMTLAVLPHFTLVVVVVVEEMELQLAELEEVEQAEQVKLEAVLEVRIQEEAEEELLV
jgi:hypothetical protein